ncbi:MAG: hypothetical protein AB7I33_13180 [Gemmatimonadales bacterium]
MTGTNDGHGRPPRARRRSAEGLDRRRPVSLDREAVDLLVHFCDLPANLRRRLRAAVYHGSEPVAYLSRAEFASLVMLICRVGDCEVEDAVYEELSRLQRHLSREWVYRAPDDAEIDRMIEREEAGETVRGLPPGRRPAGPLRLKRIAVPLDPSQVAGLMSVPGFAGLFESVRADRASDGSATLYFSFADFRHFHNLKDAAGDAGGNPDLVPGLASAFDAIEEGEENQDLIHAGTARQAVTRDGERLPFVLVAEDEPVPVYLTDAQRALVRSCPGLPEGVRSRLGVALAGAAVSPVFMTVTEVDALYHLLSEMSQNPPHGTTAEWGQAFQAVAASHVLFYDARNPLL